MRKRLVIAAISLVLLVVLGAVTYRLSQPKPGTVQWHKNEFRRAAQRLTPGPGPYRLGRTYQNLTGRTAPWLGTWQEDMAKVHSNRTALIHLGYLEERRLALVNADPKKIQRTVESAFGGQVEAFRTFVSFSHTITGLVVTAPRDMMPRVEEIVRNTDLSPGVSP